ncbi:hypothetical protein HDU86_004374 [Geranomyces michiganensis]|nr:hypothetical protein HDU86_004374 [Geranomyces michiganensis]
MKRNQLADPKPQGGCDAQPSLYPSRVEVDIFPKMIKENGTLVGLGKRLPGGGREWEPSLFKMGRRKEKKPAPECAILLMKLWKTHGKKRVRLDEGLAAAEELVEETAKRCRDLEKSNQEVENGPGTRSGVAKPDRSGLRAAAKESRDNNLREAKAAAAKAVNDLTALTSQNKIKKWELPKSYHVVIAMEAVQTSPDAGFRSSVLQYLHDQIDHLISAYTRPAIFANTLNPEQRLALQAVSENTTDWSDENLQAVREYLAELKLHLAAHLPEPAAD